MPLIAGIIPTYGCFDYAELATKSFLDSESESVAIIVDDCSPDWNEEWLSSFDKSRIIVHRFNENKGLTRSWNWGIRKSSAINAKFVMVGNSDLLFPKNWFKPFESQFSLGWEFLGPLTNAPGNRPIQNIKKYLPEYTVSDTTESLENTMHKLSLLNIKPAIHGNINGFCMVGRPRSWRFYDMFDEERYPMTHQESNFFSRVFKSGGGSTVGVVTGSFIFHYRSVTKGLKRGGLDRGNHRL